MGSSCIFIPTIVRFIPMRVGISEQLLDFTFQSPEPVYRENPRLRGSRRLSQLCHTGARAAPS